MRTSGAPLQRSMSSGWSSRCSSRRSAPSSSRSVTPRVLKSGGQPRRTGGRGGGWVGRGGDRERGRCGSYIASDTVRVRALLRPRPEKGITSGRVRVTRVTRVTGKNASRLWPNFFFFLSRGPKKKKSFPLPPVWRLSHASHVSQPACYSATTTGTQPRKLPMSNHSPHPLQRRVSHVDEVL